VLLLVLLFVSVTRLGITKDEAQRQLVEFEKNFKDVSERAAR
jgi:hypothetical protein